LDDDIIRTRTYYGAVNKVFQIRHGSCYAGLIAYNNSTNPSEDSVKEPATFRYQQRISVDAGGSPESLLAPREHAAKTVKEDGKKDRGLEQMVWQMDPLVHCEISEVAFLP
jgi:hypothetical protein